MNIRTLSSLDPARFREIACGYTSDQRYAVTREESAGIKAFVLEVEDLQVPFVKRWEYDEEQIRLYERIVAENGLSVGAFDREELVGIAIAEPRTWNRSLWVLEFHVGFSHRRHGIGRQLMEVLVDSARRAGMSTIVCETQNTNAPAIRFYERLGFRLEGIDLSYYPPGIEEVAFFMKRRVQSGD